MRQVVTKIRRIPGIFSILDTSYVIIISVYYQETVYLQSGVRLERKNSDNLWAVFAVRKTMNPTTTHLGDDPTLPDSRDKWIETASFAKVYEKR